MFFACTFLHDGNFQAIDITRAASPFLCSSHPDLFHIGAVTIPTSLMMVTRMSVHQLLLLGGCKRRLVMFQNQTMHKWICLKRKETGDQLLMSMLRWTSLKSQRNPERYICKIFGNIYMLFTGWEVRIGRNCARGLEYHFYHYITLHYITFQKVEFDRPGERSPE